MKKIILSIFLSIISIITFSQVTYNTRVLTTYDDDGTEIEATKKVDVTVYFNLKKDEVAIVNNKTGEIVKSTLRKRLKDVADCFQFEIKDGKLFIDKKLDFIIFILDGNLITFINKK